MRSVRARACTRPRAVVLVIAALWIFTTSAVAAPHKAGQAPSTLEARGQAASTRINTEDDWLDRLAKISQVAAAIAALLALPFISLQLASSRHDALMQHTAELLNRWEAFDLMAVQTRVSNYLQVKDAGECVDRLIAWEEATFPESAELPRSPAIVGAPRASKNDVKHVCNFFEDVALRYNQGQLLRDPVISSIGYIAMTELRKAMWLIHYQRGGRSGSEYPLYREWEVMVEGFHRGPRPDRQPPWQKPARTTREAAEYLTTVETQQPVRVICLPAKGCTGDRALAKQLSLALVDPKVQAQLESEAPDQRDDHKTYWRVYVMPSKLGMSEDELEGDRALARKLALALDELDQAKIDGIVAHVE